ncbi:hypothetical protein GAPWK_0443 [Gilliamella apicola]|uniref:hypothetical protein n=1 Tax=Gilliamella apicola TaxID=1196095 RepID=UPI00042E98C6|nr:hypothetical protein [Gilliamella apicola]AHN25020.1 hypothetical protein GAPWK_0443 [Gilliamella apicola]PXV96315.1 hypothetical protein C7392_10461 [Gilliamella apicola]
MGNRKRVNISLIKNSYFDARVLLIDQTEPYTGAFVVIFRRDTNETYKTLCINGLDQNKWVNEAKKFIMELNKPIDWKRPHRYCIAIFAKRTIIESSFLVNINRESDTRQILHGITASRCVLIKKANKLSFEEKIQLFTLKDWEKKQYSYEDIYHGLYARKYLYKRLYHREKFKKYYLEFDKQLQDLFDRDLGNKEMSDILYSELIFSD